MRNTYIDALRCIHNKYVYSASDIIIFKNFHTLLITKFSIFSFPKIVITTITGSADFISCIFSIKSYR